MKVLVTGLSGTIGRVLKNSLENAGHKVVYWNRQEVPIDDYSKMEYYIGSVRPDVLIHLAVNSRPTGHPNENWLVNYQWPSELAWICKHFKIKFVYTSTVMVFSDFSHGPFSITSVPDNNKGYGFEKRLSEARVMYQNPDAVIIRLGWQIGDEIGTNNMTDYLEVQNREKGKITCSTQWLPACSFIEDTANLLIRAGKFEGGLYQADSNRGWNFFEIATQLNKQKKAGWTIEADDHFVFDQRMLDDRTEMPPLSDRLPGLKKKKK
ncbi:MAG: sugar nucleotide-binding protein [Bacteroidetes bacterium]|nr:sugar nucleotide-binding protein [Bacteroidota bacterium]